MARGNTRTLLQCAVLAVVLVAMVEEAASIPLCGTDTNELGKCRPAVTGNSPPPPSKACCGVIKKADLKCLCGLKSQLPQGIDLAKAKALPAKCKVKDIPSNC